MTAERLKRLSQIKARREDRARNDLQRQLAALAKARHALLRKIEAEKAFKAEVDQHCAKVYASALGACLSINRLERINIQISEMERQISLRQKQVEQAKAYCQEAHKAAEAARKEFYLKHRENRKWAKLVDQAEEKARRATEHAAELESGDDLADRHRNGRSAVPGLGGTGE